MLLNCGVAEDSWESLDCKEIKLVNPKGNQSWIFTERNDAEVETPILRPPDAKNWLFGKDPDAGKDGRQEEKATTKDEMVGWHHRFNGHEFEQALGDGEGQGHLRGAVHGVTECLTRLSDWTTTGRKSTGNTVLWRRAERIWLNTGCLDSAPALPPHIRDLQPCQESLWLSVFPLTIVLGWLGYMISCVPNKGTLESIPTKHAHPSETHTLKLQNLGRVDCTRWVPWRAKVLDTNSHASRSVEVAGRES